MLEAEFSGAPSLDVDVGGTARPAGDQASGSPGSAFLFSTHNNCGPGDGEKPWTVRRRDFAHPRHLAELALYAPRNVRNHQANRSPCSDHEGWAMMTAAAHHFGIVIHCTTLDAELAELHDAGFPDEPILFDSEAGRRLSAPTDASGSWWFQLLVRG